VYTWNSPGGELTKESNNPWFVRNTTEVRYCVEVDLASVSIPQTEAITRVEEALHYWKLEFEKIPKATLQLAGYFELGGQKWVRVECGLGTADVRFLFGVGTLSPEERAHLGDVTDYVAVTTRTEYDPETLRGRGFVYFASDFGPTRFRAGNSNLVVHAWSDANLSRYAMIHELGHIYGFQHTGSGIMSEVFLEQMLEPALAKIFSQGELEPVLGPNPNLRSCDPTRFDRNWFGLVGYDCIEVIQTPFAPEIEVFGQKVQADPATRVRVGRLKRISYQTQQDQRVRPVVYLHLPRSQKVFSKAEAAQRSFMFGPMIWEHGASATFVGEGPLAGVSRQVYFNRSPTSFTMQAALGSGAIAVVFSHQLVSDVMFLTPPSP
jgi:hypothetical protein